MTARIFLLSPARCDGERAKLILNPRAEFPLARALREAGGVELGEVFSFLSGLYFRGKLAYARAFARVPEAQAGTLVITTERGLVSPATRITRDDLCAFADVDIGGGDERYLGPLRRDLHRLATDLPEAEVVLLGSIATGKYVDTLVDALGERVVFPREFVGRGDMSRGGLLLRCVRAGEELTYVPVQGAVRHGPRPPKLAPLR
ncbi:MAG TPA: hypothetical protein VGL52_10710 [Casimicrobiaceae bacterium]